MSTIDYQNVRLAVGDKSRDQISNLITHLKENGFHDILQTSNLSSIKEAVERDQLDIVVCGENVSEEGFCDFVSGVRQSKIGTNPFLVIIATINTATERRILQILQSGVDDLLAKPLSSALLVNRIINLTKQRRPFNVTSNYIGPDRRPNFLLEFSTPDLIKTPNTLDALTNIDASDVSINQMIQKSIVVINEQRMEHNAAYITELVGHIYGHYHRAASGKGILKSITRLILISEDIQARLEGTRFSHVAELCNAMVELARRIQANSDAPEDRDIQLLPEISNAIKKAFDADQDDVARARDISVSLKT